MDDLLLDDEETALANNRRRLFSIGFGVLIILLLIVGYAYDAYRPLPNNDYCEQQGYQAGIEREGVIACYNECPTNKIEDCKKIMAVRK